MTKRMLIDSTHAEETRVVVLDGNRLDEFDLETSTKHQLKGNIYLAKVVRVEPSLQAAFIEYGGNRHGFLAFGEIHPDYYQIPVADRKRLLEAQEEEAREAEEAEERAASGEDDAFEAGEIVDAAVDEVPAEPLAAATEQPTVSDAGPDVTAEAFDAPIPEPEAAPGVAADPDHQPFASEADDAVPPPSQIAQPAAIAQDILIAPEEASALFPVEDPVEDPADGADMAPESVAALDEDEAGEPAHHDSDHDHGDDEATPPPEQIGGEHDTEEHPTRRSTPRFLRNYKIQEVIRRRQILLIQVVKEERGSKGAALTTYISLAGRFSVLMPNSPRGGGISRKITSAADRRRLKEVTAELDLPKGMGLIVRTAGANRPKPEILRDCEYLLNQWDQIRELTMKSMAPALIYEEASLIKRAIRDVYSRDVDDILVDGEQGWRAARDFMRMLMPTHARKVQLWKDPQPLFSKAQVEPMLEAMLTPTVQLRSGGYLVINQTEALVAIDVNSGRSTRERGIEETALRTNLEAAEEAARQLRLRDLAGLIVIDFIDMENRRNVMAVERRLKDALKYDRARIQVGGISHFGLLEMSRQRLRPSLTETNFVLCPHCGGTGHVRSTESAALVMLRAIEEEGGKRRAAEIVVHCHSAVALYILNHKRQRLTDIETRHAMLVTFVADEQLVPPALRIERVRAQTASEAPLPVQQLAPPEPFEDPDELAAEAEEDEEDEAAEAAASPGATSEETSEESERRRGRRRRRRRGRRENGEMSAEETAQAAADGESEPEGASGDADEDREPEHGQEPAVEVPGGEPADSVEPQAGDPEQSAPDADAGAEEGERRRRGRRGGRRRRRDAGDEEAERPIEPPAPVLPAYSGPTPADPFAGAGAFDFFDAIEQAEEQRALNPRASAPAEESFAAVAPQLEIDQPEIIQPEPAEPEVITAAAAAPVAAEPAPMPEPEPVIAPEPIVAAEPEPAPVVVGPAIQPVVIGTESTPVPAEKKRGWWRR